MDFLPRFLSRCVGEHTILRRGATTSTALATARIGTAPVYSWRSSRRSRRERGPEVIVIRRTLVIVVVTCVAVSVTPAAEPFVGFGAGQAKFKERTTSGVSFDADETGWKVFGGAQFGKYLAVEGGYVDFGSIADTAGGAELDAEASGLDAFGVGVFPFGPRFSVWIKAGVALIDTQATLRDPDPTTLIDETKTAFAYGGGVTFRFKRVGLRVEYELFEVADLDTLNMASVGLEFRF